MNPRKRPRKDVSQGFKAKTPRTSSPEVSVSPTHATKPVGLGLTFSENQPSEAEAKKARKPRAKKSADARASKGAAKKK